MVLAEALAFLTVTTYFSESRFRRLLLWGGMIVATTIPLLNLIYIDWQIWALPLLLHLYRILNMSRVMMWRLKRQYLRSSGFSAFVWLVVAQILSVCVGYAFRAVGSAHTLLLVCSGLQLILAAVLLRTTIRTWLWTSPLPQTDSLPDSKLPSVSVLIPARNETETLSQCLQSIVASDYPKLEVLVLDDCSVTKRTPEIIRGFAQEGARFIQGKEVDERWLAKNYAYSRLVDEASGELLLFCGVDVRLEPKSIRSLVSTLLGKQKDMLSILPQRSVTDTVRVSILQPMRYFWELCLPRRMFKRPPVLSTCWLIRAKALESFGGMQAVSRSVTPEATFARHAVTYDAYAFVRSNQAVPVYSAKTNEAQYQTTLRVRYPQLHKRIEIVALTALSEAFMLLAPFMGLCYAVVWSHTVLTTVFALTCLMLLAVYYHVAVRTSLNRPVWGIIAAPAAFLVDFLVLHISCLLYEFGTVTWRGRNVCVPVMNTVVRNNTGS